MPVRSAGWDTWDMALYYTPILNPFRMKQVNSGTFALHRATIKKDSDLEERLCVRDRDRKRKRKSRHNRTNRTEGIRKLSI